ncbi:MAG: alkaline phosphatase D family protein [Saprospiraceae bacterium]
MRLRFLYLLAALALSACSPRVREFRLAFGSCGHQDHALTIFDEALRHRPDVFLFLGDNIYGDTYAMDTLRAKYGRLGAKSGYRRLKAQARILAIWDDHDYGLNDGGRHYPFKAESKAIFLDFFEEPADSERRRHEGVYHAYQFDLDGVRIQLILLDNRTFRDDLRRNVEGLRPDKRYFYPLDYLPYETTDSTLLGEAQWVWLEAELRKPADIRLIGTSTQFGVEYNGYEAWANFPHEQRRMADLIRSARAEGVVFLSGDVHYAEISRRDDFEGLYPLYDLTASGLSMDWHFATPNRYRVEGPIMDNHFGLLTVRKRGKAVELLAEVWDARGNQRIEYVIPLERLRFERAR